jgi:hypothetical protein
MPPQQHDRLLDLIDNVLDFRAHDHTFDTTLRDSWAPRFALRPPMAI